MMTEAENLLQDIQQNLYPSETILWSGQPLTSILFHGSDWFSIPFAVFWSVFTFFWEYSATNHFGQDGSPPWFFALWGIPFILAGQYMLWGRFVYATWQKQKVLYAVTNRRVMVITRAFSGKFVDGDLRNLSSVSLTTRNDGAGTIEFSPQPDDGGQSGWSTNGYRNRNQMGVDLSRLAFYDIANVREVYQTIQAQRDKLR